MMETGGSIPSSGSGNTQSQMTTDRLPESITIPLQLGYESTFFLFFNKNHYEAEAFVKKIFDLSVDYFIQIQKDRNFPVITWKIDQEIARFVNISINSDELCHRDRLGTQRKVRKITRWRKGNTMPLMLFSEDFIYHGESAHSGCTFEGSACNSRFNTNGETWGVVDLTFKFDTEEQRAEKAARTLAHELGHMVSI
jgi:hypothetical protein